MSSIASRAAIHRAMIGVQIRSLDEANRECEFVASTENPVETMYGREVLRMGGVRLERYMANPVFLDSHNGTSIGNVLGSASSVRVEGRELITRMRFAESGKGRLAWDLVRQGHVRAVSIGYRVNPDSVKRLRAGEKDGEIMGPCAVVNEWELFETSLVPVPADEDALVRDASESTTTSVAMGSWSFPQSVPFLSSVTAPRSFGSENDSVENTAEQFTLPFTANEGEGDCRERASTKPDEPEGHMADLKKPDEKPADVPAPKPAEKPVEARASEAAEETLRRRLFAITPESLKPKAEELLLRGCDFEAARAELIKEFEARNKPLGTPEPAQQSKPNPLAALSDEALCRSIKSAFGGR